MKRNLSLFFVVFTSFIIFSSNSMVHAENTVVEKSIEIDLTQISGNPDAVSLVNRLKNLKADFAKNDPTYNFLNRYFYLYSNEPKNVNDTNVIVESAYNSVDKSNDLTMNVHYYDSSSVVAKATVYMNFKINKSSDNSVSFLLKNSYNPAIKYLIAAYLKFSNSDRFIYDSSNTTVSAVSNNKLKINFHFNLLAPVSEEKINSELRLLENVTRKLIAEFSNL